MKRFSGIAGLVFGLGLVTGCVERRMTIISDPPGAMVSIDHVEIGPAPVEVPSHLFTYYGVKEIKLTKGGYEPLVVRQDVPAPWYEYFPLDFVSEHLIPWHIKDQRTLNFQLPPMPIVAAEDLLQNAEQQRTRGQTLGPPPEQPDVLPGPSSALISEGNPAAAPRPNSGSSVHLQPPASNP